MTTWNTAFEAVPADSDDHALGAGVIRTLKVAISDRLELEHNFKDGTSPSHKAGQCAVVYVGTTTQINALSPVVAGGIAWDTTLECIKVYVTGSGWVRKGELPSGTCMLFAQASAPTGWVQDTTWNDRVIRVVDGTGVGGTTTGSWTISGCTVGGHTLTVDEIPAHTHGLALIDVGGTYTTRVAAYASGSSIQTASAGGGAAHDHPLSSDGTWRPAVLDVIAARKS